MTTSQDIANDVIGITDANFFGDLESVLEESEMQLLDVAFEGVALSGPRVVEAAQHEELPLVIAFRSTGLRAWSVPRDLNALLVAVDLDSRAVFLGHPFGDDKAEEYPPPPGDLEAPGRPEDVSAQSVDAGIRHVDARAVLGLPWTSARYRMAFIHFDWMSNLIDVEVRAEGPVVSGQAHAVSPAPAGPAEPREDGSVDDAPRTTLPSYLPWGEPAHDDALPGLLLGVAPDLRSVGLSDPWIQGSLRVAGDAALVPAAPFGLTEADGVARDVTAVVPLTIVLVALSSESPALIQIAVPVYGTTPAETAQGYFAFKYSSVLDAPPSPGSYRCYALLEGRLFGPTIVEIS